MAEIAGLSLAAIALAGTFKDCIDLVCYIAAARSIRRDYKLVNTKLDLETAILLQWADRVRLLYPDCDKRLSDERIRTVVTHALACMKTLLTDVKSLKVRYGLDEIPDEDVMETMADTSQIDFDAALDSRAPAQHVHRQLPASGSRLTDFVQRFKSLKIKSTLSEKDLSPFRRARWAVRDKAKFEDLVRELSYFNRTLNEVVSDECDCTKKMASRDFQVFGLPSGTRLLLDACSDQEMIIKEVAGDQHRRMCEKRILECLWFRQLDERRSEINAPYPGTLEWILQPSASATKCWDDLPQWLKAGSNIYWVSGKPAAGKSTLMNYVFNHQLTKEYLVDWARPYQLTLASFFFWGLGNHEQRSLSGLSRGLLFRVLEENRSLIPLLLPTMWREACDAGKDNLNLPSLAETNHALEIFKTLAHEQKFCFFVDGLDEYDGNHLEVIALLQGLATNTNVKILVSSRPLATCFEHFSNGLMLKLEDLNRTDISTYVVAVFSANQHLELLRETFPERVEDIIGDLVDKSEGVFLWVVLASQSLLQGLAAGDYIDELEDRVQEMPADIEKLFTHIIRSIEPRFRFQGMKLLRIAYEHQTAHRRDDRLEALSLAIYAERESGIARVSLLQPSADLPQKAMCKTLEMRLRSRCRGLLELVPTGSYYTYSERMSGGHALIKSTVRFLHRTLFEYLKGFDFTAMGDFPEGHYNFEACAASAHISIITAWLYGEAEGLDIDWTTVALGTVAKAPKCESKAISSFFQTLEQVAQSFHGGYNVGAFYHAVYKYTQSAAIGQGPDLASRLAVELGMSDFLAAHYGRTQLEGHARALLLHVIETPLINEINLDLNAENRTRSETMRLLLVPGSCHRNDLHSPWSRWIKNWFCALDSSDLPPKMVLDILDGTLLFLNAGAACTVAEKVLLKLQMESLPSCVDAVTAGIVQRPDLSQAERDMVTHRARDLASVARAHCSSTATYSPDSAKKRSLTPRDTTPAPASSTLECPWGPEDHLVDENEPRPSKRARFIDAVISA